MKRIHQSVRVGYYYVRDDAVFADFLNWLSKNTDAIEQVSFFTSWFHPPMPLETAAEHCRILKDRITAVKALGLSCG